MEYQIRFEDKDNRLHVLFAAEVFVDALHGLYYYTVLKIHPYLSEMAAWLKEHDINELDIESFICDCNMLETYKDKLIDNNSPTDNYVDAMFRWQRFSEELKSDMLAVCDRHGFWLNED